MNAIVDLIKLFWRLFVWWTVIQPWESGLRVRLGRRRLLLEPGLHFRIPFVDAVFKQSTRLRWASMMPQTVTTLDGHTLTMSGQLGYEITDLERLYDTLHQGENAIRAMSQGAIARYVHDNCLQLCTPDLIERGAAGTLDLSRYGIRAVELQITTFCRVRTYRLIMDQHENIWEDLLDTRRDDSPIPSAR